MVEPDNDTDTTTERYHRSANGRLIGLLLIGLGVVWFLSEIGGLSGETMRAALLILLGAGLIYTARRGQGGGRRLWPIIVGVILIFALLGNARSGARAIRVDPLPADVAPVSVAGLGLDYLGGVPTMTFDLRRLQSTDVLNRQITIEGHVSDLVVAAAPEVNIVVDSATTIGQLVGCGGHAASGLIAGQTFSSNPNAASILSLHLKGGADEVRIVCGDSPTSLAPPIPPIPPSSGG